MDNLYKKLLNREYSMFHNDLDRNNNELSYIVRNSKFLILGGAGTIGQAVTKEIFKRNPLKLHVVDISENNLVELIRDIRSSLGYIKGDFQTFSLDIASLEYDAFIENDGVYDYVLNLSALKHVRSEKDPFTLMRMIEVNILNTIKTIQQSKELDVKKYFCVSTDKAANPVNMMGASKKIMELFLVSESNNLPISTARFANVAFSDGSLLHGFKNRLEKNQPIVAPNDIMRYFLSPSESGELCLFSALLGHNREVFFPKLNQEEHLTKFSTIAKIFLRHNGLKVHKCRSEEEARACVNEFSKQGYWPCLFSKSDTTGEKLIEEFYSKNEDLDLDKFEQLGIVKQKLNDNNKLLENFIDQINNLRQLKKWNKTDLVKLFEYTLPNFKHFEKEKNLNDKM